MNERGRDMSIMKYLDIHTSVSPFKGTTNEGKKYGGGITSQNTELVLETTTTVKKYKNEEQIKNRNEEEIKVKTKGYSIDESYEDYVIAPKEW